MPVTITITADTAGDALRELREMSYASVPTITIAAKTSDAGPTQEQVDAAAARVNAAEATPPAPAAESAKEKKPRAKKEAAPKAVPDAPDAATAAQDDADEAEESTAALTIDSVKNASRAYITKFGMEHAQNDLMVVLKGAIGVDRISMIPADASQDVLANAIKAFETAAETNPYNRPVVAPKAA